MYSIVVAHPIVNGVLNFRKDFQLRVSHRIQSSTTISLDHPWLTPPDWLSELANAVAGEILPVDILAPVGCHYWTNGAIWEVTLFVSKTETQGGPCDGRLSWSRFTFDIQSLYRLFDAITSLQWQALPFDDDDEFGAHLLCEGIYEGESVSLRVLSRPPERFEVGRTADPYGNKLNDEW